MTEENTSTHPLLNIDDLTTSFFIDSSILRAVDSVNLTLHRGEIFGLVGESGSGKTMTALSILRLVPPPGRIERGKIIFEGRDLVRIPAKEMEKIRGNKISMIFQEPMTSLNPVFKIGDQIAEILETHTDFSKKEIKERTIELLRRVGFNEAEKRYIQYPHQLSGGQRQRILIAMAIACNPSLVIADEPTTALDVATQSLILSLLQDLMMEHRTAMLFITHNLNVIKQLARRIGIMYAGRIMELNSVNDFFTDPLHPYSKGLVESIIGLERNERRLKAIPGSVPRLSELPRGCKFHPRCAFVMEICKTQEPPVTQITNEKWVRCYLYRN